jgi:hypothetical protein
VRAEALRRHLTPFIVQISTPDNSQNNSWVMTTFFLATSCGCLMLLLGLVRSGPNLVVARIGTLLLGVTSIGLVVSGIFPTDVRLPSTRSGEIHDMSFLVNVGSILLAIVLLSVSFGSQPRWRPYRRDELPLLERLGELREIPPGIDAVPFGTILVVAFVVLPALLGWDVEDDVLAVVLSGFGFCVLPEAADEDDFVEHGI